MPIQRLAFLSVHTSPLAPMGGNKTGGMNVYIRELAQELGQRGIQVDIFTRRSSPNEPDIDPGIGPNVRVIYVKAGPATALAPDDIYEHLSQFTARVIAFSTVQNLRYDVIYSHYWLSGWVAAKLNEAWGTPFVQMFHTLGHMKQRIQSHGAALPNQRINTEREVTEWASRIVAATPAEYAQLLWLYRARRKKIEIIPPGVNTTRFYPTNRDTARQQLHIPPDERWLLFVGRIERLKAIDIVLQALHVIQQDDPTALHNVRFGVVGGDLKDASNSEMNRLQTLTRELKLTENVRFLGAKEQHLLPQYYAAADAVLMPSDYESFGMVALEAMAMGTPVIASEVGGLAYLVRDGETGYLVPTREPQALAARIKALLNDPHKTRQMGHNAAHLAQQYAWSHIADQLLTLFEGLTRQHSTRSA
jgi:D-inositol-3-phosphate glycosyltransferase